MHIRKSTQTLSLTLIPHTLQAPMAPRYTIPSHQPSPHPHHSPFTSPSLFTLTIHPTHHPHFTLTSHPTHHPHYSPSLSALTSPSLFTLTIHPAHHPHFTLTSHPAHHPHYSPSLHPHQSPLPLHTGHSGPSIASIYLRRRLFPETAAVP